MTPRSPRRSATRASPARRRADAGGKGRAAAERPAAEVREGLEVLEELLGLVQGPADARFYEDRWITLRCANTSLYQPHADQSRGVSLRVATPEGRFGVATTSDLSKEGLKALVATASSLARVAPPTEGFQGFPGPDGERTPPIAFSPKVLDEDLEPLGERLAEAFQVIEEALGPARISGVYNQGLSVVAVANTSGLRRGYRRSAAQASLLSELPQRDPPVSGWSEGGHWDPSKVDLAELAREAVVATAKSAPQACEPGKYRVLLLGPAVSEFVNFLSYLGLGANSVEEGWSFLVEGKGKRLVAPAFELTDDPLSPEGIPSAVDFEGLPHRPRPVFHDGVAQGPAYDTLTGARAKVPSTRNAIPPEAPYGDLGPVPRHLKMAAGEHGWDELVKELKTGILVTRFWYVRAVHPGKTLLTGMTRDGTYWVENGEIKHPIRNLRFTESILDTFAGVEAIGRRLRCHADERGFFCPVLAPIVSRAFTFTSATSF
jgi:PmbA protein